MPSGTWLYYYGARYYEPKFSRWMSADPAGFGLINPMDEEGKPRENYSIVEALNHYSYCSNNPVNYVDPTGLDDIADLAKAEANMDSTNYTVRTDPWGIYSIKDGKVTHAYESDDYGLTVIIRDKKTGESVRYAHFESYSVEVGDSVREGEQIGVMGDTGNGVPGPNKHLHVSVYPAGAENFTSSQAINPSDYIACGVPPANTTVSTPWHFMMPGGYRHEGVDYSGQPAKLRFAWPLLNFWRKE